MEQVPGAQSYNCNANDVRVASVAIKQLRDASGNVITPDASGYRCSEGETLFVDFTATIENGASSARFDNAVWWRFGGALVAIRPKLHLTPIVPSPSSPKQVSLIWMVLGRQQTFAETLEQRRRIQLMSVA